MCQLKAGKIQLPGLTENLAMRIFILSPTNQMKHGKVRSISG